MRIIAVLLLSLFAAPALADWSRADTYRQVTYMTLHAVDWMQTREIARNPDYHEANPLIGENPSRWDVDRVFIATGISQAVIAYMLPPRYRRWWQNSGIVAQAGVIAHNYSAGIRVRF